MATSNQLKNMLTLEAEPGPFISFFVPSTDASHAEFNQLIINAKRELKRRYPHQRWQPYQAKLKHLNLPRFIHNSELKSLAIYLGPTILRVFRLNYRVKPTSIVNDTMWIIPLIIESQLKHSYRSKSANDNVLKIVLNRYQVARNNHQTSHELHHIISVAPAGLVDTLLINRDAPSSVKRTLNDLAITTIGFGGQVLVLSNLEMSGQIPAAIISRI